MEQLIIKKYRQNRNNLKIFLNNTCIDKRFWKYITSYLLPRNVHDEIINIGDKINATTIIQCNMYNSLKYILRQMSRRNLNIFLDSKHHIRYMFGKFTILDMSIKNEKLNIAELLINHGANINTKNITIALGISITLCNFKKFKFLMETGIKNNIILCTALSNGDMKIIKYLLDKGMYDNKQKANDYFYLSCHNNNSDILKIITEKFKINIDLICNRALERICNNGAFLSAKYIINNVSHISYIDIIHVLHYAYTYDRIYICKYIFDEIGIPIDADFSRFIWDTCNNHNIEIKELFNCNGIY